MKYVESFIILKKKEKNQKYFQIKKDIMNFINKIILNFILLFIFARGILDGSNIYQAFYSNSCENKRNWPEKNM